MEGPTGDVRYCWLTLSESIRQNKSCKVFSKAYEMYSILEFTIDVTCCPEQ